MVIKYLFSILILFYLNPLSGEEKTIEGLLFNSIYDKPKGRDNATSLTIPSKNMISFQRTLSIEFDVFFWRKSPFGFILSAGNKNDPNLFVLSYSDYKSNDSSYIELTYADRPSIISVPIVDKEQGWEKWNHVKLFFDLDRKRVGLSLQNQKIIWYRENLPLNNEMQFDFGSTSFVVEPPRMGVKNIIINRDNDRSVVWKLDEGTGVTAHSNYESGRSWDGLVTNGVWIKEMHSGLKPIFSHKQYINKFQFLGIDTDENEFIYLINDSLFYYNYKKGRITNKSSFSYLPENNYVYRYHPSRKLIFATHGGGGGPICYLINETNTWENYIEGYESDGLYYTSNFLFNYKTQDIYSLGGYGWYEQKNTLQKYNNKNMSWEKQKYFIKDSSLFFPRCKAIAAYDFTQDKYFVYGGGGNESGKQQQGFRNLNDLWVVDLNNYDFKRIWKDSLQIQAKGDQHQKVAISAKNKRIYKIVDNKVLNGKNSLLKNNEFEIFTSTFGSRNFKKFKIKTREAEGTEIKIHDFYAMDKTDELLVIYSRNSSNDKSLVFSTLKTPLIAPYQAKNSYADLVIIILVGLGVFTFLMTTKYENKEREITENEKPFVLPNIVSKKLSNQKLVINLLDHFEIVNKGLTFRYEDWKSKKARDLLILIILKGDDGISINEIHEYFWPDVNLESARNSRAVAMSHIRKVISPYDNLLVSEKEIIRFKNHEEVFIDYRKLNQLISSSKAENEQYLDILSLFNQGQIVPYLNSEWIKPFRTDLLNRIAKYFKSLAEIYVEQKKWNEVEYIGHNLLIWNKLNDDGMRFSVLANKKLDKDALAYKIFFDFIKNYELEIGNKYPLSYEKILSDYERSYK